MALRALNRASKRRRRQVQLVLAHPTAEGAEFPCRSGGGAGELGEPWQVLQGVFASAKSTVPLRCKEGLMRLDCASTTLRWQFEQLVPPAPLGGSPWQKVQSESRVETGRRPTRAIGHRRRVWVGGTVAVDVAAGSTARIPSRRPHRVPSAGESAARPVSDTCA